MSLANNSPNALDASSPQEELLLSVLRRHMADFIATTMLSAMLAPLMMILPVLCYLGIFVAFVRIVTGGVWQGCVIGALSLVILLSRKRAAKSASNFFLESKVSTDRAIANAVVDFIEGQYPVKLDDMDMGQATLFAHQFMLAFNKHERMTVQFYLESHPDEQKSGRLIFSEKNRILFRDENGKELTPR